MNSVLSASIAKFFLFKLVGRLLLVFGSAIIFALTSCALHIDDDSHKYSLNYIYLFN
jgi:hypothetical protein